MTEPAKQDIFFDRADLLLFGMLALMSNALPSHRFLQDMKAYLAELGLSADQFTALPLADIERHVLALGERLSRAELEGLRASQGPRA